MSIRIYPLNTGLIRLDTGAYITPGKGYGVEVEVPTWAFLVDDGKEKILVDTGMSETKTADWHHPGSYQPEGFRIDEQLGKLGVKPDKHRNLPFTPMGRYVNVFEMFSSMETIFARADHILTSHGEDVSSKNIYP